MTLLPVARMMKRRCASRVFVMSTKCRKCVLAERRGSRPIARSAVRMTSTSTRLFTVRRLMTTGDCLPDSTLLLVNLRKGRASAAIWRRVQNGLPAITGRKWKCLAEIMAMVRRLAGVYPAGMTLMTTGALVGRPSASLAIPRCARCVVACMPTAAICLFAGIKTNDVNINCRLPHHISRTVTIASNTDSAEKSACGPRRASRWTLHRVSEGAPTPKKMFRITTRRVIFRLSLA